jgi:alpha-glucosidase (family GH31 glycosyl hydrolase)
LASNVCSGAGEVHNIYGHYWNKMLFDKYAEHYPEERLFNLNRAGYAEASVTQSFHGVVMWVETGAVCGHSYR